MSNYKLYAVKTWGSAIVELVLKHTDLKYEVEYLSGDKVTEPAFLKINPLGQIPTLILPRGEIMTGSLAICLYLDSRSRTGLVVQPSDIQYSRFLRWSVFLVDAIYSQAAYFDHADWFVSGDASQEELKREVMSRVKQRFLMVEAEFTGPWFLGKDVSLIDVYLAVMTFWEPREEWFRSECPKMMKSVDMFRAQPVFEEVFRNNTP